MFRSNHSHAVHPAIVSQPSVHARRECQIESLEGRIAPAGLVTVELVNGVLTISGDTGDNAVEIFLDANDTLIVQGLTDTQVSGSEAVALPYPKAGIASVNATLGEGNDRLFLRDIKVKGDVTVDLGAGTNLMAATDLTARTLAVDAGAGDDDFYADDILLKGDLRLELGSGPNLARLTGFAVKVGGQFLYTSAGEDVVKIDAVMKVGKDVIFNFSGPSAEVDVKGYFAAGAVKVNAASSGSVDFSFYPQVGKITRDLSLELSAQGPNEVLFAGVASLTVGGNVFVQGGANDDTVNSSGFRLNVRGGITFHGGEGTNQFSPSIYEFTAKSVTVTGGAGNDRFEIATERGAVKGAISAQLGSGDNTADLRGDLEFSIGSFSLGTGGGFDRLYLGYLLTVKGAFAVNLGEGNGAVEVSSKTARFGGLVDFQSAPLGVDAVTVTFESDALTFAKGLAVRSAADGLHALRITAEHVLNLAGGLSVTGGSGSDEVTITAPSGAMSGLAKLDLGEEFNRASLELGRMKVASVLEISALGYSTLIELNGSGAVYTAPVTITTGDGQNSLVIGNTDSPRIEFRKPVKFVSESDSTDLLIVNSTRFLGGLDATMGGGASTARLDDSLLKGATKIDLGAGSDQLFIERSSTRAATTFAGPAEIRLGAGNDAALIGRGTFEDVVRVMAKVIVDGGEDADTINEAAALAQLTPGGSLEVLGF